VNGPAAAAAAETADREVIEAEMVELAARLKAQSLAVHDNLQRDNAALDALGTQLDGNTAAMKRVNTRLNEEVSASTLGFFKTLCLLLVGVAVFFAAYSSVKLLPGPPRTSLLHTAVGVVAAPVPVAMRALPGLLQGGADIAGAVWARVNEHTRGIWRAPPGSPGADDDADAGSGPHAAAIAEPAAGADVVGSLDVISPPEPSATSAVAVEATLQPIVHMQELLVEAAPHVGQASYRAAAAEDVGDAELRTAIGAGVETVEAGAPPATTQPPLAASGGSHAAVSVDAQAEADGVEAALIEPAG
jgi:hypothetical protein